jgi:hypothetical protein
MQIIHVHADAPLKPAIGAACNGCGVCCLAEPCPLGMLLSARRRGACRMLRWDDSTRRYRCGALGSGWWRSLARRWISAGSGCDCALEITR